MIRQLSEYRGPDEIDPQKLEELNSENNEQNIFVSEDEEDYEGSHYDSQLEKMKSQAEIRHSFDFFDTTFVCQNPILKS